MWRLTRVCWIFARKALTPATSAMILWGAMATSAAAQDLPSSLLPEGELPRQGPFVSVSVRVGSPGTQVTVRGRDLPGVTPVHVGIGGIRLGFEDLSLDLTDEFGELEVSVEVPDWAQPNRIHRFIIFDVYFRPIAYSKEFYVTDAEGLIWRRGEITHRNTRCAVLVTSEGEDYVLVGDVKMLRIGAEYNVGGRVGDDAGRCEDHVASQASIAVISIEQPNF
jgi:hypothetical protein